MAILILIIFGFSQALFLLSYSDPSLDFGLPTRGIINAFLYMMGQSNLQQVRYAYDFHNCAILSDFLKLGTDELKS